MQLKQENLEYLKKLSKNNNRDWFNNNKDTYLENHKKIIGFAEAVLNELSKHDKIETISGKKSLHRIYRDRRFSKDKTPYKTSWSAGFKRATKELRGGYFFKIEADKAWLAGGFWGPNPADLKRIRQAIDLDAKPLKKVISSKSFKNYFGELHGEGVKTVPKGFDKNHPEIELLRRKQFMVVKEFSKQEMLSKGFHKEISKGFKNMRPFFNVMSEILTTNADGESIV